MHALWRFPIRRKHVQHPRVCRCYTGRRDQVFFHASELQPPSPQQPPAAECSAGTPSASDQPQTPLQQQQLGRGRPDLPSMVASGTPVEFTVIEGDPAQKRRTVAVQVGIYATPWTGSEVHAPHSSAKRFIIATHACSASRRGLGGTACLAQHYSTSGISCVELVTLDTRQTPLQVKVLPPFIDTLQRGTVERDLRGGQRRQEVGFRAMRASTHEDMQLTNCTQAALHASLGPIAC
jgi:hypothetical protein